MTGVSEEGVAFLHWLIRSCDHCEDSSRSRPAPCGEKSRLLCCSNPDRMIVHDGFQSRGPAMEEGATRDSRDPVKTVSLTSTTVVRKKVNITLQRIHHIQLFLEHWVHGTTVFFLV